MRTRSLTILAALILAGLGTGCSFIKGWQMDYGKPAAHFYAKDVASKGKPFMGKKIRIQGEVVRVQNREDGNHIYLKHNIHCVFPTWHAGEAHISPGDEIYVSGFLERCSEGYIYINPALKGDPAVPFKPLE